MDTPINHYADMDKAIASVSSTTDESTCRRLAVDPHLQDRRDAKAAASDLRCVQQLLEEYRVSRFGRFEPDRRIQMLLVPAWDRAIAKYGAIAHPGERAERAFASALDAMHWTLQQLDREYERARHERSVVLAARLGVPVSVIPGSSSRVVPVR